MSPLRWTLVALLVASTALFAVGVIAERSSTDTHTEPAAAHAAETGGESGEPRAPTARAARRRRPRPAKRATSNPRPRMPSTSGCSASMWSPRRSWCSRCSPASRSRRWRPAGSACDAASCSPSSSSALAWAALDIREVVHQLDESRTGVAVVAMAVAALHLAVAAISGRLATQPPATP